LSENNGGSRPRLPQLKSSASMTLDLKVIPTAKTGS
jgi:hypothetical protein